MNDQQALDFRQDVLYDGARHIGIPYRWGGKQMSRGLDCSGFVQLILDRFEIFGSISTTMSSAGMFDWFDKHLMIHLPDDEMLKPGNVLFFGSKSPREVKHVSFYVGTPPKFPSKSQVFGLHFILDCGRGTSTCDNLMVAHLTEARVQIRSMLEIPNDLLGIVDIVEAWEKR